MSQKIKIAFLTIVMLMVIFCGSVFATNTVSKEIIDTILKTYGCSSVIGKDEYNNMLLELESTSNYKFIDVIRNGEIHVWISTNPYYTDDGGKISGIVNGGYYNIIHNSNLPGYIGKVNISNKNYTVSSGNPRLYFYAPNGVYKTNSTEFYYGENYESSELINDFLKPKTPWFEYSQALITDYVTVENEFVNRKFDAFSLQHITDNKALGSLYTRLNKEILQVYFLKFDLYGNLVVDYKRLIYDTESFVNGNWSGYLKMDEVGENYDKYLFYYPQSFMQPNYIYSISIQLEDGSFLDDMGQFMIVDTSNNSGGGIVIGSGDSDSIITDQENNQGDITGSINDLNNTVGNLGNTINDAILGTENESGDREGGLLGGILDGIKGLFVPSEEDMSEWLSRTQMEITDQLGILGEPINFFSVLMNKLLLGNSEDFIFHIPDLIIPGTEYKVVDAFDINFTAMISEHEAFKTIYDGYIVIMSGIMVYCFYSYLWSFYDHILGTRDVEAAYKITEEEIERQQIIQKEKKRQPIGFKVKGDNRK